MSAIAFEGVFLIFFVLPALGFGFGWLLGWHYAGGQNNGG